MEIDSILKVLTGVSCNSNGLNPSRVKEQRWETADKPSGFVLESRNCGSWWMISWEQFPHLTDKKSLGSLGSLESPECWPMIYCKPLQKEVDFGGF